MPKTKEDRSDWVAVEPEFAAASGSSQTTTEIRKATSAYQFFQKERGAAIKQEVTQNGTIPFDIAVFGRAVRDKFNALSEDDREYFEDLARQDQFRFRQESHQADVAAMERRERLQKEHNQIILDNEGGTKRTTRGGWERKQRKKQKVEQRKLKKAAAKKSSDDDESDDDDDESEEWDSEDESEDDDDDSGSEDDEDGEPKKKKRKKATPPKRKVSQKQLEYQQKKKEEKQEKEMYIAERQQDLRKERAAQAKKRLEFLLKQSNIFSHFGSVKEDTAKYGISTTNTIATTAAEGAPSEAPNDVGGTTARDRRKAAEDSAAQEEEALEEADEHEATFLTHQPTTLGFGKMREYQLEGLNWMVRLQENGVNGILADEMGLGKTLQSISVLVYMLEYRNVSGPHLIVVPKSTLSNWMNEIARWAPTLTAVKFHGDKAAREEIIRRDLEPSQRDENRKWNVVVTTYEVCNIEKNTLGKFAWSYLIIDEAHRLKNEASAFSKTIRSFETRYRLLLTGTPLQNSLHELWALLNFLVPDVFESAEQFDEWFNLDIDDNDEKNKLISQLHKILKPFVLRRLKADVERSLPPKHETILFTGMSTLQKKLYRDILQRDIEAIRGTSGSRTAILNIVMQLRKCAGHPYLVRTSHSLFPGVEDRSLPPLGEHLIENCGKMVLLDKLLKRMRERGHRVLLFTQMTRVLDILEDYLVMRRFAYCRIDGNTSYEAREAYIEAYNKPDSEKFLFLLSTRAGGLGINLQTADVVILYDSDWNPQCDLQAQDRAHRIGQKRPVQVFRFVTEHTIEEKIVERAQQKLKLDAMVVQQGRLKGKDNKLSRDELLAAVRFGADKIFKSKDSSITDDDIDLIMDQGKAKTEEMNEKLKAAEKGDLLDFKLDGTSVQTFEGIDYSGRVKAQEELLGIFDIGKRERKEANYNENKLYQQQIAALQGAQPRKPKKKKALRLPKHLRLPRMDEFQMYDKVALQNIQEEEEAAFKELPEEQQKAAIGKKSENTTDTVADSTEATPPEPPIELPPLLSEEMQTEKKRLLAEGFADWNRNNYNVFWKSSARHGRKAYEQIAVDVGKTEAAVKEYAEAFWGDVGKSRISEHEYERVVKFIERGEKKIAEVRRLERGTRLFVSLFENPWEELEFIHVHCKDKLFTAEEDRYLLCWARKYGYGQWQAVKLAVRRNPNFRFDYWLRSLPVDLLGRRCDQLMKAAEKEVEHYERMTRESKGLPVEPENDGEELPPVELPMFHALQSQLREARRTKAQEEKRQLEEKVDEIGGQIQKLQARLKALNSGAPAVPGVEESAQSSEKENVNRKKPDDDEQDAPVVDASPPEEPSEPGATGGDGAFVPFPEYDGAEAPVEWKKPFTHFCNRTRRQVKASLDPEERKNKKKVNKILKQRWLDMPEEEKEVFRLWTEWDKKRFAHEEAIFERQRAVTQEEEDQDENPPEDDGTEGFHVPRKKKKRN